MTILFAGGEEGELTKLGQCTVDTTTSAARRGAFARCALKIAGDGTGDGWVATFAPTTAFWITAQMYCVDGVGAQGPRIIALMDSNAVTRLALVVSGVGVNAFWRLVKIDAGVSIILATSSTTLPFSSLSKLDVYVNYAVAGQFQLYESGTLVLSYTGDVTTNAVTTLAAAVFGTHRDYLTNLCYWSEIIVATIDTRSLSLATLAPAAAGNANTWTSGTVADINELSLNDLTAASSAAANQVFEITVTASTVPNGASVVAVVVNARAQKGNTGGPTNAAMMVRVSGADYLSASQALPAGALSNIASVWETNPATGAPWLQTELTAAGFNIGVKSLT